MAHQHYGHSRTTLKADEGKDYKLRRTGHPVTAV